MIQAFNFGSLELDKFVLFDLLELHFILQPVKYLVLSGDFVLDLCKLLLEDLLTLLRLSKLFPKNGIRAQLLLQIVDLVVMLLLLN